MIELNEIKQLLERLFEDQRRGWQAREPRKVEEYLAEHPWLAANEEDLLDFIYAEFCLREECGETVAASEYQDRFPQLKTSLSRLFEVHFQLGVNGWQRLGIAQDSDLHSGKATQDFSDAGQSTSRTGRPGMTAADSVVEPTSAPLAPGEKIGRYRIERGLGSGSFGSVYQATDEQLQRSVAVKVLRPDRLMGDAEDRFLEEARTVARLKHLLIVPVYDVGRHADGRPYVVMELVQGQPLSESLASGQSVLPARAAELIATVAEAMAHAHREGFVHRDLKPANIILDPSGLPHVLDFGLAIHESSQRGRAGEMVGTLAYMAPEQVRRESHRLDGRADIWALGVMLYELLTGRRPFDGKDPASLCDEILHREPRPPRQVNEAIPAELERICLKCLQKDVSQRYLTARDLASDLRRWAKPQRAGRRWLWATAAVVGILLAFAACWVASSGARKTDLKAAALHGKIDIRVWKADDPTCQDTSVADPKVRPLRVGDRFSIRTELSRPAYLYVLDIDGQGKVAPLYPWQPDKLHPDKWPALPSDQKRVERVSLPDGDRLGKIKPPGGMETLLLLARESPLTDDTELRALLSKIPPQPIQEKSAILILTNGRREDLVDVTTSGGGTRGFDVSDADQNDSTTLQSLQALHERLVPRFSLVRTITVANRGE